MGIPQLESCCCGCSLKTGSKIIGWVSLIGNVITVITVGFELARLYRFEEQEKDNPKHKEIIDNMPALKALAIMQIIVHIIGSTLSFVLLLGVYQNKVKLILTWVLIALTAAIVEQVVNLMMMIAYFQSEYIATLLSFVVELYFILVVYSFYREVRNVGNYP